MAATVEKAADRSALKLEYWGHTAFILLDIGLMTLIAIVVFYSRFSSGWIFSGLGMGEGAIDLPESFPLPEYLGFFSLYVLIVVLLLENQNLYRFPHTQSAAGESVIVARIVLSATILIAAVIFLSGVKSISRLILGVNAVLNGAALISWRLWRRHLVEQRVARGDALHNVLIVGAGRVARELGRYFLANRQLGVLVKGYLADGPVEGLDVVGNLSKLSTLIRLHFVDEIYVADHPDRELVRQAVLEADQQGVAVKIVPDHYDRIGWGGSLEHVGDVPVLSLRQQPIPLLGLLAKRVMDIILSAAALVLLSPVLMVIAGVIKSTSRGSILYRAPRLGKKRRQFYCHKFRTMVSDAEIRKDELLEQNERDGLMFKMKDDPRITPFGRFLRRYSLDELPQLWNVLKGEMSLVGPRPPSPDEVDKYDAEYYRRLEVTPGLTGLWQIHGRQDPSFARVMALDMEYIENWSLWLDFKILLETIPVVLKGTGT